MNESVLEDRLKQLSRDVLGDDDVVVMLILDCVRNWLDTCERINRRDTEHIRGASLMQFLRLRLTNKEERK